MDAERLDVALAARGLARSRSHAATLVAEGSVTVGGVVARKPSLRVGPADDVRVTAAHSHVGRGARKLAAALDAFDVDVRGALALDAGASTGGFTEVLLERGAERVIALDVGHGQLAPSLATDPRVVNVEGVNVRGLDPAGLATVSGVAAPPRFVVADLSFISLVTVMPALAGLLAGDGEAVLLVKPQFEVGRTGVRGGIVREGRGRAEAVARVLASAHAHGLGTLGLIPSPLEGTHGNREFLAHCARRGGDPSQWWDRIRSMAGE